MENLSLRQELLLLTLNSKPRSIDDLISQEAFGDVTNRTFQRDLRTLEQAHLISKIGAGRATKYQSDLTSIASIRFSPQTLEAIFKTERNKVLYNFEFLEIITRCEYNSETVLYLNETTNTFNKNKESFVQELKAKEMERIIVEISWKSSVMEGNTYSLLETENLLKYGVVPGQRNKFETQMILGHKDALEFVIENAHEFKNILQPASIIQTHKLLTENLGVTPNIRASGVAITASSYVPLDNQYQITEELQRLCDNLSEIENSYHKALVAFVYLAYLQPFNDGNKRTARIVANAILNANESIPISFRSVDISQYISSLLLYYEYGIFGNMRDLFLEQVDYTYNNYYLTSQPKIN